MTPLARWRRSSGRAAFAQCGYPDAVFDTGCGAESRERAGRYGLAPAEYRKRNLLQAEVTSDLVAKTIADLCSDRFAATTGAQIPIDGGSERTI